MSTTIISKHCPKCKTVLSVTSFGKNRSTSDGYSCYCKACQKRYRETDIQKAIRQAYMAKYHQTEKHKQYDKAYKESKYGRAMRKQYRQSDAGKVAKRRYEQTLGGKAAMKRGTDGHRQRFPDRRQAGVVVNNAVAAGHLPPISTRVCSCGKQAEHYHHPSYDKDQRLNVIPVCADCHRNIHKELAEAVK